MQTLKMGVLILLAVIFSAACGSTEISNQNTNQSQNANQSAPAQTPANSTLAEKVTSNASNANAARLYTANACAGCHGAAGKGVVKDAPDFSDAAWQNKKSDSELITDIKKGKLPKMPAYGEQLNDEEIKALAAYIRTFAK